MADNETPEPTEPSVPATEEDVWKRVEGIVETAVGKALGSWESKKNSGKSSVPSTPDTPVEKTKTFLEKLISG